ncbi:MAG: PspC domain-containing protein [Bacillota bacterium]|nr:PspC domain-containing protein [Bacillota bacterium]
MAKRLYRSRNNRVIAGVCGGISEYFQIDPVLIRLIFIITGVFGAGVLVYFIAMVIMPREDEVNRQGYNPDQNEWGGSNYNKQPEEEQYSNGNHTDRSKLVIGVGLILFGCIFLFKQVFPWFHFDFFWPALVIAIGLFFIFKK